MQYQIDSGTNQQGQPINGNTATRPNRPKRSLAYHLKKSLPQYLFTLALTAHGLLHSSPALAQFFVQGETYANQIFPTAQPITTVVIGGIRLIFIYLIGTRALSIISGGRGQDKISDLAQEIVILLITIIAIDAVLLLILPTV